MRHQLLFSAFLVFSTFLLGQNYLPLGSPINGSSVRDFIGDAQSLS